MDYPENWPQPSSLTAEGASSFASAYISSVSKDGHWWAKAEDQTAELITSIQPIQPSEERRQDVDFVQRLIKKCSTLRDCQVVTELKETWAADVHNILKKEEQNADAEFRVKEVQYIHADADRLIVQKHLFKRIIILVKAWCYYESRILGAHNGLISTFALDTLVLYIFHVFHASLRGPFGVNYEQAEDFLKPSCIRVHGCRRNQAVCSEQKQRGCFYVLHLISNSPPHPLTWRTIGLVD